MAPPRKSQVTYQGITLFILFFALLYKGIVARVQCIPNLAMKIGLAKGNWKYLGKRCGV